ncbi:MAG TPA: tryptophan--tRNA ligase [Anaeromyxobacteraceae bacterium]|nr:tryptophan--tRNA ligase [Anaeromyxobacteraceae bacterium]
MTTSRKPRVLTGDTPTGKLHLGHWVGSLENRVAMQSHFDCFFIIANKHAFSTLAAHPEEVRQNVLDIAADYLAAGIDPARSAMFIQSEVPAIDELTFFFAMLLPFNRVMRNPTLKDEIRDKELGDTYPFGFPLYAVGQTADILAFRPELVPVGEDQLPHLEMTREVARRFDQLYCGVDPQTDDRDYVGHGGLFPIVEPKLGRMRRLVGTGGPGPTGELQKMGKSLGNAIFLSDDADTVQQKVMGMYTDPKRLRATDPGTVENNPVWIFHEAFNPDPAWIQEHEQAYREGRVGDVAVKRELVHVLNAFLEPIRARRRVYESRPDDVIDVLRSGTVKANVVAEETLALAKEALRQDFFPRALSFPRRAVRRRGRTSSSGSA